MKTLKVLTVILVAGCASPQQRAADLIVRYGHQCGVSMADANRTVPPEQAKAIAACLEAHERADRRAGARALIGSGAFDPTPLYTPIKPSRSVNCVPTGGGGVRCTEQ